jgi:hypothetical protein
VLQILNKGKRSEMSAPRKKNKVAASLPKILQRLPEIKTVILRPICSGLFPKPGDQASHPPLVHFAKAQSYAPISSLSGPDLRYAGYVSGVVYTGQRPSSWPICLFLGLWIVVLVGIQGLFQTVEIFSQLPLFAGETHVPACWEQTIQPTFYRAFLEPGMSTSSSHAFLIEPAGPDLSEAGYASPSGDRYAPNLFPSMDYNTYLHNPTGAGPDNLPAPSGLLYPTDWSASPDGVCSVLRS